MDPSAPQTVLKGVAITSSLCGAAAGLYGGFKHGTASKFLLYSALNSGIVAATFFSIREYVVSPVLVMTLPAKQYRLRRQKLLHVIGVSVPMSEESTLSWADIRTSRLLDSGASGGLAGSIFNAWKRGRRGLIPGFTTGVLICTLLQWCFNEFNILRIRYVSTKPIGPAQQTIYSSTHAGQNSVGPFMSVAKRSTPELPSSPSPMDGVLSMFGQRISDEKYLERLKMERDSYLRRIAELEEKKNQ